MNKINRHEIIKMLIKQLSEVVIKIEVKDNNETSSKGLKRKLQRDGFLIIKIKIHMKSLRRKRLSRKYKE